MTPSLDTVPPPPFIRTADESANRKIGDFCLSLYRELTNLQSCIALFDHTSSVAQSLRMKSTDGTAAALSPSLDRDIRITHNWPLIAAREALSALFNFHWALKELNEDIARSTVKDTLPDPDGVMNAYEAFERSFGKAILARHATSHRSEISNNFEKNAHRAALSSGPIRKKKGATVIITDCLSDRTFTGTRKGEILKFDVSWESYQTVREIYEKIITSVAKDSWRPFPDQTSRPR